MRILCLLITLFFFCSLAYSEENTAMQELISHYLYGRTKEVQNNNTQKNTKTYYDKDNSDKRGLGFYQDDQGGIHFYFGFGNTPYIHSNHHDDSEEHDYYSGSLSYLIYKYGITDGAVFPLVYRGKRIGSAIVTGNKRVLYDIEAVVIAYEGSTTILIPVDRHGYRVSSANVFAFKKIATCGFPYYKSDNKKQGEK